MKLQRLTGSSGLANAVSEALSCDPSDYASTLLVFDFDRTLTNGISSPGDEADLAKVVRGGEATVAALRRAHEAGVGLYIITARRPSRLTVEQLFASLDKAQAALSPFFHRGDGPPVEFRFASTSGSVPLARGGHVYAADYEKAAALAHIVRERRQERLRVFFFDDSVVNSFVVGTSTANHLGGDEEEGSKLLAEPSTSYWWDSFEEETGPSPSMGVSSFGGTDSNYAPHLRHMLSAYGISSAEGEARIEAYRTRGTPLRRDEKPTCGPVAGAELASVEAASRIIRANMSGLAGALGARFARGPRPPSAPTSSVRLPNAAYNAFEAGKALHNSELAAIRAAAKTSSGRGAKAKAAAFSGLGALLGARAGGGWRAEAEAKKARAATAVSLFEGRGAASLPPGPLPTPRWETAFQVDSPDAGTTGGLAFVATLAGAYAIKSADDVAEEYFGSRFLRAAGVPVPDVRVVFPHDAEHAAILAAVERVAKQYSRRGDSEGGSRVMVHVSVAMRKFNGPLLLMELVPAAVALSEIGTAERARVLLEPEDGAAAAAATTAAARARARLEAMGRVWVVDAALNFRDRFASRLTNASYDAAVAYAEGRAQSWGSSGDEGSAAPTPEQMKSFMTGNLDNILLTDAPLVGGGRDSAFVAAGAAAIDSHIKLVRGDTAALVQTRETTAALLREELGALLTEARDAETGGLAAAPSPSLGWLRFTINAVSGLSLSDGALAAARLGALRGVASVPQAVAWARSELAAARRDGAAVGGEKWASSLARIDEDALVAVGRTFESLLAEHADLVRSLPAAAGPCEGGSGNRGDAIVDDALLAEAELIGATPALWAGLSGGLRKVLLDERVHGVPSGPHSVAWPGWEDEDD